MNSLERIERAKDDELLKVILEQREQICNDIECYLDGMSDTMIQGIEGIVVDRLEVILIKYEEVTRPLLGVI